MNRDEIQKLYDRAYAADYENRFINGDLASVDANFEVELIGSLLKENSRWLDCACGTGYFLSKFPQTQRAGLDLSVAMLERSRSVNPGVEFFEWDFRNANPAWNGKWDLVSCMWYAYGLVDSLREVELALSHFVEWTAPGGTLFLPYSDPRIIARANFPYETTDTPWSGRVFIEGIIWSYVEDEGTKNHAYMISPTPEFIEARLKDHFRVIDVVDYPPAMPGWEAVRKAFVAKEKIS
ncbi:class I SAM-dependent methyltransferase [bacterium]|nr:class I SAM-dependent methyltransferase [bacterium]